MRSIEEIAFRLRQEVANVALWLRPPRLPDTVAEQIATPVAGLPDPVCIVPFVKDSDYGRNLIRASEQIVAGQLPLLGLVYPWRPPFGWRRDFLSGLETPLHYFRRIPYLNPAVAGDHKIVWEPSRLQYLVGLAQALHLEDRPEFCAVLSDHLESWFTENPFQCGINWTSALEVAFRALSLIWIFQLAGNRLPAALRKQVLTSLYQHGWHLQYNLSLHFSPNTHLLGEAVALHAIGALFPQFPSSSRWRQLGARVIEKEASRQVHRDGGYFEQSTYYHVYALDMFLFHAVVSSGSQPLRDVIGRMAEWLDAMVDQEGRLPFLGDDDGGRFFSPDGHHDRYALGTLATAGALLDNPRWIRSEADLLPAAVWWLGSKVFNGRRTAPEPKSSRLFPDTGLVILQSREATAIVDAGPFGPGSGGHSHSDTLSLILTAGAERILIDPGTYTYLSDPAARNHMRGSAAHNTVRIAGLDQAEPAGPFRWNGKPQVEIAVWKSDERRDFVDTYCRYAGFCHRRRVVFLKPDFWLIADDITGPGGVPTRIEQFWHPGEPVIRESDTRFRIGHSTRLTLSHAAKLEMEGETGWVAPALGRRHRAPMLRVRFEATLPCMLLAAIELAPAKREPALTIDDTGTAILWGSERFPLA